MATNNVMISHGELPKIGLVSGHQPRKEIGSLQMYLCGHRSLDFVSQDGKRIQGTQLSVSYPAENVTGELVDRIFVRQGIELPGEMTPGDILDIAFNNKGKPEKVTIVKQGK